MQPISLLDPAAAITQSPSHTTRLSLLDPAATITQSPSHTTQQLADIPSMLLISSMLIYSCPRLTPSSASTASFRFDFVKSIAPVIALQPSRVFFFHTPLPPPPCHEISAAFRPPDMPVTRRRCTGPACPCPPRCASAKTAACSARPSTSWTLCAVRYYPCVRYGIICTLVPHPLLYSPTLLFPLSELAEPSAA